MLRKSKERDEVYSIWKENPSVKSNNPLFQAVDASPRTIRKYLSEFRQEGTTLGRVSSLVEGVKQNRLRTVKINELIDKERLDTRKIIRGAVRSIPVGELAYDDSLRKDLGISMDKWREASRDEEFEPYRALLPTRKVVWGKRTTINELKLQDGVS